MKKILLFLCLVFLTEIINGFEIMDYDKVKFLATVSNKRSKDNQFSTNDPLCSSHQQCGENSNCCKYTAGCYCSLYDCTHKCGGGGGGGAAAEGDKPAEGGGKLVKVSTDIRESEEDEDETNEEKDKGLTEDSAKNIVSLLQDIKSKLSQKETSNTKKEKEHKEKSSHKTSKAKKEEKESKKKEENIKNDEKEEEDEEEKEAETDVEDDLSEEVSKAKKMPATKLTKKTSKAEKSKKKKSKEVKKEKPKKKNKFSNEELFFENEKKKIMKIVRFFIISEYG